VRFRQRAVDKKQLPSPEVIQRFRKSSERLRMTMNRMSQGRVRASVLTRLRLFPPDRWFSKPHSKRNSSTRHSGPVPNECVAGSRSEANGDQFLNRAWRLIAETRRNATGDWCPGRGSGTLRSRNLAGPESVFAAARKASGGSPPRRSGGGRTCPGTLDFIGFIVEGNRFLPC